MYFWVSINDLMLQLRHRSFHAEAVGILLIILNTCHYVCTRWYIPYFSGWWRFSLLVKYRFWHKFVEANICRMLVWFVVEKIKCKPECCTLLSLILWVIKHETFIRFGHCLFLLIHTEKIWLSICYVQVVHLLYTHYFVAMQR